MSLSTDPPQVCHGNGATINDSRNEAVLTALRTLSKLGLDASATSEKEKPSTLPSENDIHDKVKKDVSNQVIDK